MGYEFDYVFVAENTKTAQNGRIGGEVQGFGFGLSIRAK
jgi:hypothetical protein